MTLAEKYINLFFKNGNFSDLMDLQWESVNTEFTRTEKLMIYVLDTQGLRNMGQLTTIFSIPHSTTNFLVTKLKNKGIVATQKNAEDHRVIEVFLTEQGKEKAQEIMSNIEQRLTILLNRLLTLLDGKMEPEELAVVQKAIQIMINGEQYP
jgi:DNA-binding MarR family transcriptional regulator